MNNRRKSLLSIAGISSTIAFSPNEWAKPIVDVLVLPAHAQTSNDIELISDERIGGNAGSDLFFLDATVSQSGSTAQFSIRINADLSQFTSTIGPHLSSAILSTEADEMLVLGGCDQDKQLATIIEGENTIELGFDLEKGKTYTGLSLQFYPYHCAPSFLGAFIFSFIITS